MDQKIELILSGAGFKKLIEKEYIDIQDKYGLLKIDLQIITFLNYSGERNTSKDIVELGCFTKGHVSQSITRMRSNGYIKTERDKKDKRFLHLYFGEKASELVKDIKAAEARINDIVFKDFDEEEMKLFERMASKIANNLSDSR